MCAGGGTNSLALVNARPLVPPCLHTRVIDRGRGILKVHAFQKIDRGINQIFVCAIFMEGG